MNINEQCTVVLTRAGARIANTRWDAGRRAFPGYDFPIYLAGDELTLSLWEWAELFGPHLHAGADTLFERNDLQIHQAAF